MWKKEDGITLPHLTRQVNRELFFFFLSQCNYSAVLSGIAHVVLPLALTLLWLERWMKRSRGEM